MPIVTLLREWSEREPERCSYVGGMFAIRGWTLTHEEEISERLVNSEIQCAVQEAIEARDWNWYLGRVTIDEALYYKSKIALPPSDPPQNTPKLNIFLSTHSPTHVLLQAYLQALATTNPARKIDDSTPGVSELDQEAGDTPLQIENTIEETQNDAKEAPPLENEVLQTA